MGVAGQRGSPESCRHPLSPTAMSLSLSVPHAPRVLAFALSLLVAAAPAVAQSPFTDCIDNSSRDQTILVLSDRVGFGLSPGDEIAIYTTLDEPPVCAGLLSWQAGQVNQALIAYGDDPITPNDEGLEDGELMQFRIWFTPDGGERDDETWLLDVVLETLEGVMVENVFVEGLIVRTDTVGLDVALAVEVAAMEVLQDDGAIEVRWQTIGERGHLGTEVLAARGTAHGHAGFERVAWRPAAGADAGAYYVHRWRPEPGRWHVRLGHHDVDGHVAYSRIETVVVGEGGRLVLAPSPARSYLEVDLPGQTSLPARVAVYDALGRRVWDGTVALPHRLDVSRMAAGAYLVRVEHGTHGVSERFVVAR